MREVTDPAILKEFDAPASGKLVTDPNILKEFGIEPAPGIYDQAKSAAVDIWNMATKAVDDVTKAPAKAEIPVDHINLPEAPPSTLPRIDQMPYSMVPGGTLTPDEKKGVPEFVPGEQRPGPIAPFQKGPAVDVRGVTQAKSPYESDINKLLVRSHTDPKMEPVLTAGKASNLPFAGEMVRALNDYIHPREDKAAAAKIQIEARQQGLTSEAYKAKVYPEGVSQGDRAAKGFASGVLGTTAGTLGAAEWVFNSKQAKSAADEFERWSAELVPDDPTFLDQVYSGSGSMAVFFVPGMGAARGLATIGKVAPRLALWGGSSVMAATEAMTEAGSVYRDVFRETGNDGKASDAASKTFWMNMPLLVVTNKLGIFGEHGGAVKRILSSGGMEGAQEMGQTVISSTASGKPVDPKEVISSGGVGAVVGALTGGLANVTMRDILGKRYSRAKGRIFDAPEGTVPPGAPPPPSDFFAQGTPPAAQEAPKAENAPPSPPPGPIVAQAPVEAPVAPAPAPTEVPAAPEERRASARPVRSGKQESQITDPEEVKSEINSVTWTISDLQEALAKVPEGDTKGRSYLNETLARNEASLKALEIRKAEIEKGIEPTPVKVKPVEGRVEKTPQQIAFEKARAEREAVPRSGEIPPAAAPVPDGISNYLKKQGIDPSTIPLLTSPNPDGTPRFDLSPAAAEGEGVVPEPPVSDYTRIAREITDLYDTRPRPLNKMFGKNPTAAQKTKHEDLTRKYNNKMSKLRRDLKKASETEGQAPQPSKEKVSAKEKAANQTPIARVRKGGGIRWTADISGEIRKFASQKEGGRKAFALQVLMRRHDKNPKGYMGAMAWDKWVQTFQEDGSLPEDAGIEDLFELLLENKPGMGAGVRKEDIAPNEKQLEEIVAREKKAAEEAEAKAKQDAADLERELAEPRGDIRKGDVTADELEITEGEDGKWRVFADDSEIAGPFQFEEDAQDVIDKIRKDEEAAKAAGTDIGASPEQTKEIANDFKEGIDFEPVTRIFDSPKKSEIFRTQQKAQQYVSENGWMSPEEAKAEVAKWKANAKKQGKDRVNGGKVVLSLFDLTGEWARPWHEAGYDVFTFDIQNDPSEDIKKFGVEYFGNEWGDFGDKVYAVLSANPCTDFAVSGARHFAVKDAKGQTIESVELVHQTLRTVEYFRPSVWALENPVGRIEKLTGLPPWRLAFDPNHFGAPYTKKTLIWGRFNGDLPIAPVEPTEGSKMWSQYGGKSQATKNARAETPEGFAYAFFQANNFHDNQKMAVSNKYDLMDPGIIEKALDAGMTEEDIGSVVDDMFYDQDIKGANEALLDAIKEKAPAEEAPKGEEIDDLKYEGPRFVVHESGPQKKGFFRILDTTEGTTKQVGPDKGILQVIADRLNRLNAEEAPRGAYKKPKPGKAKQTEAAWPIDSKAIVAYDGKEYEATIRAVGKVRGDLGSRVDGSDSRVGDAYVEISGLFMEGESKNYPLHLVFDPAELKKASEKVAEPARQDFGIGDEVQFFTTGKSALQEGWKHGIVQGIDTKTGKVLIKAHNNVAFPIRLVKRSMDAVRIPEVAAPSEAKVAEQVKKADESLKAQAEKQPIFPGEKSEQQPFKLDTEEAPVADAPLVPEAAGEQDELFPGERAKYRAPEKGKPAPPPEGGLFGKKAAEPTAEDPVDVPGMGSDEAGFSPEEGFRKKPGEPVDTDKPMSRSQIARFLAEKFDIPLRVGRFKWALGIFKVKPEVIRTKFANDIEVIAHEIGHALHKHLWPGARTSGGGLSAGPLRAFQDELLPIATKPRKGGSKTAEGFAEFIRKYVVDEAEARRVAPKFYKFFEEKLDADSPDTKAILLKARADYKRWLEQPALARVMGSISQTPVLKSKLSGAELYTSLVDALYPLEAVIKEMAKVTKIDQIPTRWNAYKLAHLMAGWKGKADAWLLYKPYSFKTYKFSESVKSYREIMLPVGENRDILDAYLVSRRSLVVGQEKSGILDSDARQVIEYGNQYYPEFKQAALDLKHYQNALLRYLYDGGVINGEQYLRMRESNEDYVPFYRIMDYEQSGAWGKTGYEVTRAPLHRFKGSWRDIVSPTESIIKNTYAFINAVEKNAVGKALVDLSNQDEGQGKYVEKIPADTQRIAVKDTELEDMLRKYGKWKETTQFTQTQQTIRESITDESGAAIPPGDRGTTLLRVRVVEALTARGYSAAEAETITSRVQSAKNETARNRIIERVVERAVVRNTVREFGIEIPEGLAYIYRPSKQTPRGNVITVMIKGKATFYEVDPRIYKAFHALDKESANTVIKIMAIPSRLLRVGATLTPEFALGKNPIRDQWTAFVNSKYGYKPHFDFARGLFSAIAKDKDFWRWKIGGGEHAAMVSMDRESLDKSWEEVMQKHGVKETAFFIVTEPIDMLRAASEFTESATRIGEFKAGLRKMDDSKASIQDAAYASRELTLPFSRMGTVIKPWNMITAFMNANIQDLDKIHRQFKEYPRQTTIRLIASITIPSILLAWATHDDKDIKEIASWQKDIFWILPTDREWTSGPWKGSRVLIRIPKPFVLGTLFGSFPERIVRYLLNKDPHAMDGFVKSLMQGVVPPVLPTGIVPLIENWANKSMFTDRAIVPKGREGVLPEYKYQPYTTETAKKIGSLLAKIPGMRGTGLEAAIVPPANIENLIRGYTGGLGTWALHAADKALRVAGVVPNRIEPTKALSDYPFMKAFVVRYPTADTESIKRFFDDYNKAQMNLTSAKLMLKRGEIGNARAILSKEEIVRVESVKVALTNAHRLVELVYENPTMLPGEKRRIIDQTYMNMTAIAREGNKALDAYKERRKAQTP